MTWIRTDLWAPSRVASEVKTNPPHVIIADRDHWVDIHAEIRGMKPDFPVKLIVYGGNLYGHRIRSWEEWLPGQMDPEWQTYVETRVVSEGELE